MLSIKSHNPLITWTHQVTLQINVIVSFPQNLWSPNLIGWWLMIRSQNYKIKCLFDHVLMWGYVTNKKCYIFTSAGPMVTKSNRMMAYGKGWPPIDQMTQESFDEQKRLISISTRLTTTKLDKVVAYDIGSPRKNSHDSLITWSYVVSWQMKNVVSPIDTEIDRVMAHDIGQPLKKLKTNHP